jgi:energy-coupling factor transporter ATP-binding protein EcfA2
MFDFLKISTRSSKQGIEIYPKFVIRKSSDLMIRGGDFYAIWLEDRGLWSTDEQDALDRIDYELDKFAAENKSLFGDHPKILHIRDSETRLISSWHQFCQKDLRDSYHMLDEKLIFSNMPTNKKDYASKRLSYPLEKGSIEAYDRLMSVLYSPEERMKIEWAIGSIVSGESRHIQKFLVLYGSAGTGKSTVLNIIQQLFDGYYSVFDAKALGNPSNAFALEAFKTNPLVALQHDGDLSRIEDNTRLNSLVSHEIMTVNEKFKSTYSNQFKAFLFVGTNKPVKITDAKSGLLRRLIDVSPSGNKLSPKEYKTVTKQIAFELGAIAYHCQDIYLKNPGRYDDYIPLSMLGASNDFYNYILDSYYVFKSEDSTTLKAAWAMYRTYCDDAKVPYPLSQRLFKEELKNYFYEYSDRYNAADGNRVRSYYQGFRTDKIDGKDVGVLPEADPDPPGIEFLKQKSRLDDICADCPAQYGTSKETPSFKWDDVVTRLKDLDTQKLHYVRLPENHIVIDFDIPGDDGKKSFERNLKEASKWPPTYAELSKSGAGIHLHYIYTGDVSKLSSVYDDHIEVKIFSGKSSLRRKLAKCNNLPIATINSGLPLKGEKPVINKEVVQSEKGLRTTIKKCLRKEVHADTRSNIDFIYKVLEDAYNSGMHYDVSDMENAVICFAMKSTNQSDYCLRLSTKMHFRSEDAADPVQSTDDDPIIFFDVEVFPNLFLIVWKIQGAGHSCVRMINPKPKEVEELFNYKLVGFNNRRYDNHILYAAMLGYSPIDIFKLSNRIINDHNNKDLFGEAYNISYTDIYDFASAANKKSLKKFEIELGIHHQELGLPWDQPVPENLWNKVAEYCENDVIATEAVFNYLKADWSARLVLAKVAGMTPNDSTNSLSTRIIFGKERRPQSQFNYRNMGDSSVPTHSWTWDGDKDLPFDYGNDIYNLFDDQGRPVFPGYMYDFGKSFYRDVNPDNPNPEQRVVGEGGYVYAEPGMYSNVVVLDVASMHPSSIIAENLFGDIYTKRFAEIKEARVAIKHKEFDKARSMLNGSLNEAIDMIERGELTTDDLSLALKTVINSVYGLTSAAFENPFKDKRNKDNIVAKRGALFMINLRNEVQSRGFTVAHIKTDSIKIPNATSEIIEFCMAYGKAYGYIFEHESTYEKMCLVNKAVLIAKYADAEWCKSQYGYIPEKNGKHPNEWSATGTQFSVPYVFKTLFSHDPIEFKDLCETKSVTTALYLDMNEKTPDEHNYIFVGRVGQFCPIKPGCGGGLLLRETTTKTGEKGYAAATGSKGYRWMESETVRTLGKENDVDESYYISLVDDARIDIGAFGDAEWFIDGISNTPPWEAADEPWSQGDQFAVR